MHVEVNISDLRVTCKKITKEYLYNYHWVWEKEHLHTLRGVLWSYPPHNCFLPPKENTFLPPFISQIISDLGRIYEFSDPSSLTPVIRKKVWFYSFPFFCHMSNAIPSKTLTEIQFRRRKRDYLPSMKVHSSLLYLVLLCLQNPKSET